MTQNPYSDIIDLERPVINRPKLSPMSRAAQFAPFSALETFKDTLDDTTFMLNKLS